MDTPLSLLEKVRLGDCPIAWDRFCNLYYPLVLSWCRFATKDSQKAEDLAQEVFIDIFKGICTVERPREGSLRAWIRRVMLNRLEKLKRARFPLLIAFDELNLIQDVIEENIHGAETYQSILERASLQVQRECSELHWTIFHRLVFENETTESVAKAFGVTCGNLRIIRFRLLGKLKQAVCELMISLDEIPPSASTSLN